MLTSAQLVFITSDMSEYFMSVFDMIEGKEILLVSENFEDKRYVMLNLYDSDDNKILFEINKPNILNQKLLVALFAVNFSEFDYKGFMVDVKETKTSNIIMPA